MASLPDLWRTEVLHPLAVHAPLVLLPFGTACRLAGALVRDARWAFLAPAGRLALAVGAAAAWLAVFTGSDADGVVGKTLCDPTVAKSHEQIAWAVAILFTVAVPLDLGLARLPARLRGAAFAAVAAALVVGSGLLVYTGHLGATLVYQQAAGVHRPSPTCVEFE